MNQLNDIYDYKVICACINGKEKKQNLEKQGWEFIEESLDGIECLTMSFRRCKPIKIVDLQNQVVEALKLIDTLANNVEWVEDTVINWQDEARAFLEKWGKE